MPPIQKDIEAKASKRILTKNKRNFYFYKAWQWDSKRKEFMKEMSELISPQNLQQQQKISKGK